MRWFVSLFALLVVCLASEVNAQGIGYVRFVDQTGHVGFRYSSPVYRSVRHTPNPFRFHSSRPVYRPSWYRRPVYSLPVRRGW